MVRIYLECMGNAMELPIGETIVGRDVGCSLRFNDPAVSRRHLRFIHRQGDVFVEDLGSANGTLVNGKSATVAMRVGNADSIRIGSRELVVRVLEDGAPEPSTLVLEPVVQAIKEMPYMPRALTARMHVPVTTPPVSGNQRCPQCGAPVRPEDEECASCNFRWGGFRPTSPTAVGNNPLKSPIAHRKYDRYAVELHLVYVSSLLEIEAMTRDLSVGGVFVCSEVLDDIGTACQLTLLVDGTPPLRVRGIVRRVVEQDNTREPAGMGVEFTEVGPHERAWFESLFPRGDDSVVDEY